MGSKTFDGVWFTVYSKDHPPPHVHGQYAGVEVILELDFEKREIRLARRSDRIKSPNAKKSSIKRVRRAAEEHGEELFELWEASKAWGTSK